MTRTLATVLAFLGLTCAEAGCVTPKQIKRTLNPPRCEYRGVAIHAPLDCERVRAGIDEAWVRWPAAFPRPVMKGWTMKEAELPDGLGGRTFSTGLIELMPGGYPYVMHEYLHAMFFRLYVPSWLHHGLFCVAKLEGCSDERSPCKTGRWP